MKHTFLATSGRSSSTSSSTDGAMKRGVLFALHYERIIGNVKTVLTCNVLTERKQSYFCFVLNLEGRETTFSRLKLGVMRCDNGA